MLNIYTNYSNFGCAGGWSCTANFGLSLPQIGASGKKRSRGGCKQCLLVAGIIVAGHQSSKDLNPKI